MSREPATAPAAAASSVPRAAVPVLAVLVFSAFVMMLNETTLGVAMLSIMSDLSISAGVAQWLMTGFMLTMAVVLPTTGWMLQRFSTRSVFTFAITSFLIGTLVSAVSPSFAVLLAGRVAQGVGTAIIMPLLMTVAMTLVPASRRGAVMGLITVVIAVAPALGPIVSGLILSLTSWHGIFWAMLPLVAVAGIFGRLRLPDLSTGNAPPFDLPSVILSVFAFGGLVYGLSSIGQVRDDGSGGQTAVVALAAGALGLVAFVWRQLVRGRSHRALLDLRPLGVRNFTLATLVLVCLFGAMLGALNTLPLYLQGSLLLTTLASGLVLLPGGLLNGALAPFVGRLFDLYGPRPLIVPGMILVVATMFWLSTVDQTTLVSLVVVNHVLFCTGLALLFTTLMTTAMGSLPRPLYSHGSAILNTLQQLAGAAGTAVLLTVYSNRSATVLATGASEPAAIATGASAAFLTSAVITVVALVLAVFIRRAPVAESDEVVGAAKQVTAPAGD